MKSHFEHSDAPLFWVNVVEQRALSNWIAAHFQVRHESPQLLFINDNRVVRILNHSEITREALQEGNRA